MRIGLSRAILRVLSCVLLCGSAIAQEAVPRFEPSACPFEGAEVRDDVQCGYLVVPENRSIPDGRTLRLSVAVLKSSSGSPHPDPLVFLSGGPGDPSVKNTIARLDSPFWTRYREKRDLIFFDQRGTGYSDPEFCTELSFSLQTSTFRGLSAADRKAFVVEAVDACRKKMLAKGIDFASYNSITSAQDLDDLRRALDHEQWNLFGVSYGTRLALTAMRDTPSGIRSVVIDSVWPPNAPLANSKEFLMRSIDLVLEQCAASAECRSAFPALEQDVFSVLDDFEARPLTLVMGDPDRFPDGRIVIDGNLLGWGMFAGFYERDFVNIFPLFIRELSVRNEDVLAALVDGLVREPDLSSGLQYAVDCNEWITRISPEMVEADESRHPQLRVWQAYADQEAICDAWHDQRAAESALQAVRSEIPTLLFAGEFDPITPPEFGRLAADTLPNSTLIEVPAVAHGAVPFNDCTKDIMGAFLDQPAASLDTSCIATIDPVRFTTDVYMNAGIYRLAKQFEQPVLMRTVSLGLVLLLLLSAVVVWPIAALLRRIRRRPLTMPGGSRWARPVAAFTALLGIGFVIALGAVIVETARDNPYLLGFGVPGNASPIFVLPWLLTLGTVGVMFFAVVALRRHWWNLAGRLHYLSVACACVGLIAGIAELGLL